MGDKHGISWEQRLWCMIDMDLEIAQFSQMGKYMDWYGHGKISTLKYSSKSSLVLSFRFSKCVSHWLDNSTWQICPINLCTKGTIWVEGSLWGLRILKGVNNIGYSQPLTHLLQYVLLPETGSVQAAFSSLPFLLQLHLVLSVRDSGRYWEGQRKKSNFLLLALAT